MFDIITIGSATTDVFVKAKAELAKVKHHQDVCYPIGGKVLVDSIQQCTGGGGTNTAFAFEKMGFRTGWVGKLGIDHASKMVLDELQGVSFLGSKAEGSTGYSVILRGTQDRTILTYKGLNDKLLPRDVQWKKLHTKWFYSSAMLGASFKTLIRLRGYARKHGIRFAFNPSSYMASWGLKKLFPVLDGIDILVLNKEEAGLLLAKSSSIASMLSRLQEYARLVVITDGKNGAWATNGIETYCISPRKVPAVETTGAGDSFAAGFVAGILRGKTIPEALNLGVTQSASVIQHIGAKHELLSWKNAVAYAKNHPSLVRKC